MAENPATWGEAEKVIDRALTEGNRAAMRGMAGWSLAKQIAEALREAGLLDTCLRDDFATLAAKWRQDAFLPGYAGRITGEILGSCAADIAALLDAHAMGSDTP